jgi:glutamine synthetase
MFNNVNEMISYVNQEKVKVIDFKVTDLKGTWRRVSITSQKLNEDIMKKGIGFDASSYGFSTVEKSDMMMVPDVKTCYIDPTAKVKTLTCIADIYQIKNQTFSRFEDDPRYIAQKAEKYILDSGYMDEILLGPEFEFYVLDHISYENKNEHMEVKIDSTQAEWNMGKSDSQNLGNKVGNHKGYHLDSPQDASYDFRTDVVLAAEDIDIPIKYHHGENGGPGQVEIEVEFASIVEMADRTMKLKHLLRNMAKDQQKVITFLPKPFSNECGSGMHVHIQVKKDGKYIMFDENGYSKLSKIAHYMIGGLLKHARSLTALTNPTTNSYKRLIPGFEAPVSIAYATANRSSIIRIPGYTLDESEKRFEYRSPDAMSNPYLVYAALMMAAIDGIENKIDPTELGYGPYDVNLYDLPEDKRNKIESLPKDLLESIEAINNDYEYLTKHHIFSKEMIDSHNEKLKKDHEALSKLPHPYEFELYFNR